MAKTSITSLAHAQSVALLLCACVTISSGARQDPQPAMADPESDRRWNEAIHRLHPLLPTYVQRVKAVLANRHVSRDQDLDVDEAAFLRDVSRILVWPSPPDIRDALHGAIDRLGAQGGEDIDGEDSPVHSSSFRKRSVANSEEGIPLNGSTTSGSNPEPSVRQEEAGVMQALLPQSNASIVSPICINHTAAFVEGLMQEKSWAVKMLDSLGKPPTGILQGALKWPGAFTECRSVRAVNEATGRPDFAGKYCTVSFNVKLPQSPLPTNSLDIGVCIPSTCGGMDMTVLLKDILSRWNVTNLSYVSCIPEEDGLDAKAAIAVVICSLLLVCILAGTVVDLLYVQGPQWAQDRQTNANGHCRMDEESVDIPDTSKPTDKQAATFQQDPADVGRWVKLMSSFSVYTNGAKLLSTAQPPGSLTCVHGVRFLSMTWVVLGHAFVFQSMLQMNSNLFTYYADVLSRWSFQAISNAGLSVDTFFVLSGLLVSYLSLKEMKKKEARINWVMFYFHRFWRLTPALMLVIMVNTCLSPYWGEGPFWVGRHNPDRQNCETSWWTNLLYINNLVHTDKPCMGQTWYLANDMQFYILSPLLFVPFYYSQVAGYVVSGVFLLATAIVPGMIEANERFTPGSFARVEGNYTSTHTEFEYYYIKPWNRMGPYVIGMLAGYFLYRYNRQLRINKWVNLSLWAVAAGSALAVLYGLFEAGNGHPLSVPVAALYVAVSRQVWGACVAWVVVACVTGNGGFVNTVLSWPALVPLSRLTYCIYLLHIMLLDLYLLNRHSLFYITDVNVVIYFLGVLVVSYMAALICSLAFEAPMMALEKVIFRPVPKPKS